MPDDPAAHHPHDADHDHPDGVASAPMWEATPSTCPERRPGLATVAVDDELVVAHPEAFAVLHFDPVTTVLWRSFAPGITVRELAEDVADALELPLADAEEKLLGVVTTLGRTGFLVDPAEPPMRRIPRFPTIPPDT